MKLARIAIIASVLAIIGCQGDPAAWPARSPQKQQVSLDALAAKLTEAGVSFTRGGYGGSIQAGKWFIVVNGDHFTLTAYRYPTAHEERCYDVESALKVAKDQLPEPLTPYDGTHRFNPLGSGTSGVRTPRWPSI
jgi:hypothetical protein